MTGSAADSTSFEQHLAQVNLSGARLGYLLSAMLMPAGFTLDWAMAPHHLVQFLWFRVTASLVALALLAVSYLPWAEEHPVLLGAGPPLVCASGIEAMILQLGGVASPYYAGLNLCILAVGVLYTWHWRHAVAVTGVIALMWLLPGASEAAHGTLSFRPFFNNLYFIVLTSVISVSSTVVRYRSAGREYDARTGLARTSNELEATLERLRELDRMKNEFFTNVSHELRTPLTLILAPVEELLSRARNSPDTRSLAVIRRNAQRLLRLIDDLLDLVRLDVGGLRLIVNEVDLPELARRVLEGVRPAADVRGVDVSLQAPETTENLFGDPHRLEIVLTNLVGNAYKFVPDGGHIQIVVEEIDNAVSVEVRDDGPGIPPAMQERIFERFYQVEGSERRRHGGAGIGLALARELVLLHDGELGVKSEPDEGSTFRMTLPTGRAHFRQEVIERRRVQVNDHPSRRLIDSSPHEPPDPTGGEALPPADDEEAVIRLDGGRRPRVLVAEDEDDLREFICAALDRQFDVSQARDGREALELARAERPDLVLTDVMMPHASGADLCRAIKSEPQLRTTPVVMLTARTGSDAALEGYNAGADEFVTKPFHNRVLIARLRAQLKLRALGLQLADQARLATAGTLAAGIAHEVKNPVNAVLNAARVLKKPGRGKIAPERLLSVIEDAADRILGIVSALEHHVRPAEGAGSMACDVRVGLDSTLRLLAHRMSNIEVERSYATERLVIAPARELNQVFLNLLDNAVRVEPAHIWLRVESTAQGVRIEIADDGPGVPPDVASLIFQPFFTTREVGEGTGLGLYLSRRIIDDCGGELGYRPREGGGSEFIVELPATEAQAA